MIQIQRVPIGISGPFLDFLVIVFDNQLLRPTEKPFGNICPGTGGMPHNYDFVAHPCKKPRGADADMRIIVICELINEETELTDRFGRIDFFQL